jgi:hypothetical protein
VIADKVIPDRLMSSGRRNPGEGDEAEFSEAGDSVVSGILLARGLLLVAEEHPTNL